MKFSCQCCEGGVATHVYELLVAPGATILFCSKHLETFKRFAGDVREIKKVEKSKGLTRAEAKEVARLIESSKEEA